MENQRRKHDGRTYKERVAGREAPGSPPHPWAGCTKKESPESSSLNSGGLRQNGGYLLSHLRSTIGVAKLNFSVRNGKRWDLRAITTLISFLLYLCFSLYKIQSHTYTRTSNTTCTSGSLGLLVMLGFDVAIFTPASYLRHRL